MERRQEGEVNFLPYPIILYLRFSYFVSSRVPDLPPRYVSFTVRREGRVGDSRSPSVVKRNTTLIPLPSVGGPTISPSIRFSTKFKTESERTPSPFCLCPLTPPRSPSGTQGLHVGGTSGERVVREGVYLSFVPKTKPLTILLL